MNLFIAVIQEGFDVSEDIKRREQVRTFIAKVAPRVSGRRMAHNALSIFSVFRSKVPKQENVESGTTTYNLLMKEAVVRDFMEFEPEEGYSQERLPERQARVISQKAKAAFSKVQQRLFGQYVNAPFGNTIDRQIVSEQLTTGPLRPNLLANDAVAAYRRRNEIQADYLKVHPHYNRSMFFFSPESKVRRFCQMFVAPPRGDRFGGQQTVPILWWGFSLFTYLCIIVLVVVTCYTTPLYQLNYYANNDNSVYTWFAWVDVALAIIFTIEAIIKMIADGFIFTPNAYIWNIWNNIDLFVLLTLWINVIADLTDRGGLSRAFRAFKALRALRLVHISESARDTFHHVFISGFGNLISAAFVAIALLIPYAIWALNIFNGLLYYCNDGTEVTDISQCMGEFSSSPENWNLLTPRVWSNPSAYNFDDFPSAILILFEIVSQEGWIDVMTSAMSITGRGLNASPSFSPQNAIFFVLFNLSGTIFILTVFITVIIQSYTERSGMAYLTSEQRSWQELRKVMRQLRPSRRPAEAPHQSWRAWCYNLAIQKQSWWYHFVTCAYGLHVIILMTDYYGAPPEWAIARNGLFMVLIAVFSFNILIRWIGLGSRNYLRSYWNLFDLVIILGAGTMTISVLAKSQNHTFLEFQELFLTLIVLNYIPRNDALDQLFKTAASSFPSIFALMAIWLVFFLVYAIAMTQIFGLTRIGPNGSGTLNFRTIPYALIVLFRCSVGEGWNSIMHDFAVGAPNCVDNADFYLSDCGSRAWAYFLFISWNILSMYIFVNMMLTLVYENFSYVFQRAGKLKLMNRGETRRFKNLWAKFDPHGTGYISTEDLARFFVNLRGVFDVRIYPDSFSCHTLINDAQTLSGPNGRADVSLTARNLNHQLRFLPVNQIRANRRLLNNLYEEALMSSTSEFGLSFNSTLLLLAHYRLVDDNKSLE